MKIEQVPQLSLHFLYSAWGLCDFLHQLTPVLNRLSCYNSEKVIPMFAGLCGTQRHNVADISRRKVKVKSMHANRLQCPYLPTCVVLSPSCRIVGATVLPSRTLLWQLTLPYVTACTDCLIYPFITVDLDPTLPETCVQILSGWLGIRNAEIVELFPNRGSIANAFKVILTHRDA